MPPFQPCVHRLPGVQCWDAEIVEAHTAHMYVRKCVNTLLLMTQLTSKVGIYFGTTDEDDKRFRDRLTHDT